MLNMHIVYNPPSTWSIMLKSGGRPSQFSRMKKFRALVVPGGGYRKGVIIQVIMTPMGVLTNGQSCLRRKGDATGASFHDPIHRNITYVYKVRSYIYKTRLPEQPHSPIR